MWSLRRRAHADSQDQTDPEPDPESDRADGAGAGRQTRRAEWSQVAAMPLVSRTPEPTIAPNFEATLTTRQAPMFLQSIASTVRPPQAPTVVSRSSDEGTRTFAPHPATVVTRAVPAPPSTFEQASPTWAPQPPAPSSPAVSNAPGGEPLVQRSVDPGPRTTASSAPSASAPEPGLSSASAASAAAGSAAAVSTVESAGAPVVRRAIQEQATAAGPDEGSEPAPSGRPPAVSGQEAHPEESDQHRSSGAGELADMEWGAGSGPGSGLSSDSGFGMAQRTVAQTSEAGAWRTSHEPSRALPPVQPALIRRQVVDDAESGEAGPGRPTLPLAGSEPGPSPSGPTPTAHTGPSFVSESTSIRRRTDGGDAVASLPPIVPVQRSVVARPIGAASEPASRPAPPHQPTAFESTRTPTPSWPLEAAAPTTTPVTRRFASPTAGGPTSAPGSSRPQPASPARPLTAPPEAEAEDDPSGGLVEAGFAHWSTGGELVFASPITPARPTPSGGPTIARSTEPSTASGTPSPRDDPHQHDDLQTSPVFPTVAAPHPIAREADSEAAAPASPAVSAAPAAAPAGGTAPPSDLDELARRLYPRLRAHLKADLRTERERAGGVTTRR